MTRTLFHLKADVRFEADTTSHAATLLSKYFADVAVKMDPSNEEMDGPDPALPGNFGEIDLHADALVAEVAEVGDARDNGHS